jgi:hypothetical protein
VQPLRARGSLTRHDARVARQAGCVNVDMLSRLTVVNTVFSECISYGNVRRLRQK